MTRVLPDQDQAGGLGCPALQYLVAAGVGAITVVDDDVVDATNLQRQVLHGEADVERPKVDSAVEALRRQGDGTTLVGIRRRVEPDTVLDLMRGHHLVVDGTDNFPTRYVLSDAAAELGIPVVWGSLLRAEAQVSTFWSDPRADGGSAPGRAVTLRDLFPVEPDPASVPACGDAGVLGALCGVVGSIMALEVVKLVSGTGEPLLGRVLFVDAATMRTREIPVRRGVSRAVAGAGSKRPPSVHAPSRPDVDAPRVSPTELAALLATDSPPRVLDVRESGEIEFGVIPGAIHVPLTTVLDDLPLAQGRLGDDHSPVVVVCKAGGRARTAAAALRAGGMIDVRVLDGGMLAWADEIDPTLPRY